MAQATSSSSSDNTLQHLVLGATMGTALGGLLGYMGGKTGPGPKFGAAIGALLGGGVAYGTYRSAANVNTPNSEDADALRRAREVYEEAAHRASVAIERARTAEETLRRGSRRGSPSMTRPESRGFEGEEAPREEAPREGAREGARFEHPEPMERGYSPRAIPNFGFVESSDEREREMAWDARTGSYTSR